LEYQKAAKERRHGSADELGTGYQGKTCGRFVLCRILIRVDREGFTIRTKEQRAA
jgi:hypothetical protein